MSEILAPPARTFSQFLGEVESGEFQAYATEQLRDLIGAIGDHAANAGGGSAGGALNMKFKFKIKNGVVEVSAEVETKKPKEVRQQSIFWVTEAGDLSIYNPRQFRMPFRDVSGPGEARTVNDPAATPRTVG
jgi:hypothetical protein